MAAEQVATAAQHLNGFTEFDTFVCIVILISVISAMLNGLLKDILSLGGWIGAAVLTFYFFPVATKVTGDVFKDSLIVNVIAVITLFIVILSVISLFNRMVLDNLRELHGGLVDRSFGALFGLMKGVVIVSVIHFCILVVADKEPEWLVKGRTYKLTGMGAEMIMSLASDYVEEEKKTAKNGKADEKKNALINKMDRTLQDMPDSELGDLPPASGGDPGADE